MRRQLLAAAAIVAVSLGLGPLPPQSAAAQQIVFDPRAVAQAVQQVRQGLAQIQQLQAQVTNQMAMLQKLGTDVTQPFDRAPANTPGTIPTCNHWCAGWMHLVTLPGSSVLPPGRFSSTALAG